MTVAVDLDRFLAEVEKKAFHMARYATRDPEEALDIVQDSMMLLAKKYADRTADEWRPLFFRILQNRITDWHRRSKTRRRWFQTPSAASEIDPLDQVSTSRDEEPEHRHRLDGARDQLRSAVERLPLRQQQAFLLRSLEDLSVEQTAKVMGCTQGSVKTHHFRAVRALRAALKEHWE